MKSRIIRWGNSLGVRIPEGVAKQARLKEGDFVELTVTKSDKLEISHISEIPSLPQLVDQITPENRHGEIPSWQID